MKISNKYIQQVTIDSLVFVNIVTQYRQEEALLTKKRAVTLKHNDYMRRIRVALGEVHSRKFESFYLSKKCQRRPRYYLPIDECLNTILNESRFVRGKVYDHLANLARSAN